MYPSNPSPSVVFPPSAFDRIPPPASFSLLLFSHLKPLLEPHPLSLSLSLSLSTSNGQDVTCRRPLALYSPLILSPPRLLRFLLLLLSGFIRRRRRLHPGTPPRPRPPCGAPPQVRGVLRPRLLLRPPRGPDRPPLLRPLRRRTRLLRSRGARQPQLRGAPRGGRLVAGGALPVAPRQGDRRHRPGLGHHPLRHRPRPQATRPLDLRGPARLLAGRRRSGGRFRVVWQKRIPAAEIIIREPY